MSRLVKVHLQPLRNMIHIILTNFNCDIVSLYLVGIIRVCQSRFCHQQNPGKQHKAKKLSFSPNALHH